MSVKFINTYYYPDKEERARLEELQYEIEKKRKEIEKESLRFNESKYWKFALMDSFNKKMRKKIRIKDD